MSTDPGIQDSRTIPVYLAWGKLRFAPGDSRSDPAYLIRSEQPWSWFEGEVRLEGRPATFSAESALLAARCGWFGLSIWDAPASRAKAPARPKRCKEPAR